jgi:hypothetical protein
MAIRLIGHTNYDNESGLLLLATKINRKLIRYQFSGKNPPPQPPRPRFKQDGCR